MKRLLPALLLVAGCNRQPELPPVTNASQINEDAVHASELVSRKQPSQAEVEIGRRALSQFACISCHVVPGMIEGHPTVGPPLNDIGGRRYIAGVLPNTRENLVRWIEHPQQVDPLTAMPDLNVDDRHARAMVAYLYAQDQKAAR